MSNVLKVKFKIGEIEFEAEGLPEDVSNERNTFMNTLLPAAVEAMISNDKSAVHMINVNSLELYEAYSLRILACVLVFYRFVACLCLGRLVFDSSLLPFMHLTYLP